MTDPLGPKPRDPVDDRTAVKLFGVHMTAKLRANSHKAHWSTVSQDWLFDRLCEEVAELSKALDGGDPESIVSECSDVANFCLFIADNAGRESLK